MQKPQKLILLGALFALLFIYVGVLTYFTFSAVLTSGFPGWFATKDGRVTHFESNSPASVLQNGDEIVLLDGSPYRGISQYFELMTNRPPGQSYEITIRRDGVLHDFKLQNTGFPTLLLVLLILGRGGISWIWLLGGLLILLLQPNNKLALMLGVNMGLSGALGPLPPNLVLTPLPSWLAVFMATGFIATWVSVPLSFHFYLLFPDRSKVLTRFPRLEWLIYLPWCLLGLPSAFLRAYFWITDPARFLEIQQGQQFSKFGTVVGVLLAAYVLGGLIVMVVKYFQVGELARRKIRVVVLGGILSFVPFGLFLILQGQRGILAVDNFSTVLVIAANLSLVFFPISIFYAIARHQVIPVSLIIRSSVQYLFAKNALRILLALPIIGLVATIAAHPERSIAEVLFRNSAYFYFLLALAIVLGLVFRKSLTDWMDRKFFREAYNQEKILRELIDEVRRLDSMAEIWRLVCLKVDSALHPTQIFLYYREQEEQGLSLGYATDQTAHRLQIPGEFQLLKFMEMQDSAVDFPFPQRNKLPQPEKDWLAQVGAHLIVPMTTSGQLVGLFVLGEKRSEIPYTTGDRELLERLADEMALVHENARLREHVARDQKQAFIPPRDGHESNLLKECPRCGTCYDNSFQSCEKDSSELVQPIPVDRVIDNRYQLDRLIGKGGMGSVYEGTDLRLNRQVAIKLLKGDTFGDRTAQVRFEHEAKISARLSHTNIITVHDYGVLGNAGAFLIMELARGETLRALLKRKGFLEPHAAATLLDQVLNGLKAAHALGVVHRDLKPENIFLDSSSATAHVKILDFGLAKVVYAVAAGSQSLTEPLTAAGTAVGTFGYMAPEQLSGGIIDERTDLFAFGVIVVEMLTGHRPFEGVTYQEVLTKVLHVPYHLPNTSVSSAKLDQVLQGCLAKDPTKRFQSAAEVQAQLIPALSACPSFVVGPGDTDAVTKKYNIQ